MRQLLLLIFVFFASQWLFKKLKRAQAAAGAQAGPQGAGATRASQGPAASRSAPQLPDPLVRCAECGVHTPKSEAIVAAGHRFCCTDHAQRYAAHPTGRDAR
ncbi:PP0621 family protein [Caballeronia sp. LjRoot31]|uniref:PP0621 family protein n=1 Tax=Caballeronia sp. LjRoot31 TaxID=3342324 RepID=UPI003ECE4BD6